MMRIDPQLFHVKHILARTLLLLPDSIEIEYADHNGQEES